MAEQIQNPWGLLLYKSDMRLLKPPNWLNDNCINFYFNHLQHDLYKHRPDLLFMDPTVVSCLMVQCTDDEELQELGEGIEVSSKSWVFIPVNDRLELDAGCMHWSLLVYDAVNKGFTHYDSSRGCHREAATATAQKFWALLQDKGPPPEVQAVDCPQQTNGYDCGMYMLMSTKLLAHNLEVQGRLDPACLRSHLTPDYITEQRRRVLGMMQALVDGG